MRIVHGGDDFIHVRLLPRVVCYLLRCDGQSLRYGRYILRDVRHMRFEPRNTSVKLLLIGRKLSLLRDNKLHGSFHLFVCHIALTLLTLDIISNVECLHFSTGENLTIDYAAAHRA